ncbi:MAG: vWA domain-containing protein [Bythopirellula sp.]
MLLLIAVSLVFVLAGVVFSVDVAYMHLTRTELKAVTDLSAGAAVEALTREQQEGPARTAAIRVAGLHQVGGKTLELKHEDIVFGRHVYNGTARLGFSAGVQPYTAIRIDGKLTEGSQTGSVGTFFGGLFGLNSFELERSSVAAQMDRDIALVLDISTSMLGGSRFDDMIDAAHAFLDEIDITNETEHVSIVTYNHSAATVHPLTYDTTALRTALNTVAISDSGTGIGEGLLEGTRSLSNDPLARPLAYQQIVLMTDGNHNTGINPVDAAPTAVNLHHVVNTITFSDDANQSLMIDVANIAGGIHLHADNNNELIDAFRAMARSVELQVIG